MLKYVMAAWAFKAFSLNAATKKSYRALGNRVGGRKRASQVRSHYIQRAHRNLAILERSGAVRDGIQMLEIGTGWVHWEALFTRLFYDVQFTVFDVWDNRQFEGFLHYCRQLQSRLPLEVDRPADKVERAVSLLAEIVELPSFDAVYERLGFRYLIDAQGSLEQIEDESIDCIISSDVMEHIPRNSVKTLLEDMMRILKPGAFSAHQIVTTDHLIIYDGKVNSKNYLRYSDATWKRLFENDVQYFNRIQHSEWIRLFEEAGFAIRHQEITSRTDISSLHINRRFADFSRDDLEGTVSHVVARKSPTSAISAAGASVT